MEKKEADVPMAAVDRRPIRNASIAATRVIREATAVTKRRSRDSGIDPSTPPSKAHLFSSSDSKASITRSRLRSKKTESKAPNVMFNGTILSITGLSLSKLQDRLSALTTKKSSSISSGSEIADTIPTLKSYVPGLLERQKLESQVNSGSAESIHSNIVVIDRASESEISDASSSHLSSRRGSSKKITKLPPRLLSFSNQKVREIKVKTRTESPRSDLAAPTVAGNKARTIPTSTRTTRSVRQTEAVSRAAESGAQNNLLEKPIKISLKLSPAVAKKEIKNEPVAASGANNRSATVPSSHDTPTVVSQETERSPSKKRKRIPSVELKKPRAQRNGLGTADPGQSSPLSSVQMVSPAASPQVQSASLNRSRPDRPIGADENEHNSLALTANTITHDHPKEDELKNGRELPTLSVDNLRQHDIQLLSGSTDGAHDIEYSHDAPFEDGDMSDVSLSAFKAGPPLPLIDPPSNNARERKQREPTIESDASSRRPRSKRTSSSSTSSQSNEKDRAPTLKQPSSRIAVDNSVEESTSVEEQLTVKDLGGKSNDECSYCGEFRAQHPTGGWVECHETQDDACASTRSSLAGSEEGVNKLLDSTQSEDRILPRGIQEQIEDDFSNAQSELSGAARSALRKEHTSNENATFQRPICDTDLPAAYVTDRLESPVLSTSNQSFRVLATADNFIKALEDPKQRSAADLQIITENAVEALVSWQIEWAALEEKVAAASARKPRNPLEPQHPVVWEDRKEADLYGFRYDPSSSKLGAQDIFGQRSSKNHFGRELRRRGRGKREWTSLVENDDDGALEPRGRGRPRRNVRAATDFSEQSIFDSAPGSQRNGLDTPYGSPGPRKRGRGRGTNSNLHARIRDLRDGDTPSLFSSDSEGTPAPTKRRGRPSKAEKDRMLAFSGGQSAEGAFASALPASSGNADDASQYTADGTKPIKSQKRSDAMKIWWAERKNLAKSSQSATTPQYLPITSRSNELAPRGSGGGGRGGRKRGSVRGAAAVRGRGRGRGRGNRGSLSAWIEPRPIEPDQAPPSMPMTPTRPSTLTEYERFQLLASGEGSEGLGRGHRRVAESVSASAAGTPILSQDAEGPKAIAMEADDSEYGGLVDTAMEDDDEDNDDLAKYGGFVDDDSAENSDEDYY
ncbi:MAG: hypothetical protein M1814_004364 [Vezdaea aestivalis]|nr:MAG: hypothetical protein M1814_004364 [Vezdaea aestivalis]